MQGHYFIRDGEFIYQSSVSTDKDYAVVEGATHRAVAQIVIFFVRSEELIVIML
jgi:hypothetical protein